MEPNYNYYSIDIADIWEYERSLFLNGKSSEELAIKIIHKIEDIIIIEGTATFGTKDYDKGGNKFKQYFTMRLKNYQDSYSNLESRYSLNYFFTNDFYFHYDKAIILNNNYEDFEFWFALKLRQYNSKISSIKDFLDFQLGQNFNDDAEKYINFLTLNIRQFNEILFESRIVDTVNDWIEKRQNRNDKKTNVRQLNNKGNLKKDREANSFHLKKLESNKSYLKTSTNREIFLEVFSNLKKEKFIAVNTAFDNLIEIFSNKIISESNRIVWIGTNVELQWFVKYLVYHSQKVKYLKNDIWLVTIKCFVNGKKEEFTISQLRDAKGKRLKRKQLLEEILSLI